MPQEIADRLRILVVDDEAVVRESLSEWFEEDGHAVQTASDAQDALRHLKQSPWDLALVDIKMPGMDGLELQRRMREVSPDITVIIMTAHSDLDSAVAAYQGGAFEYLPKPFDVDEVVALVRRAARSTAGDGHEETGPVARMAAMIGQAPAMQDVFRTIGRLAGSSMNVLITGESGTGKELVARALHEHSPRARQPFVALNTTGPPIVLATSRTTDGLGDWSWSTTAVRTLACVVAVPSISYTRR